MAQKIINGQTYDMVVAVNSAGDDISSGGSGGTTGGATETTLTQVRDRLPSALVSGRLPVDVESLTVTVSNAQLEIANDTGNPVPVSGSVSVSNFPTSTEISNDSGNPIPVSGTVAFSNTSINVGNFPATQTVDTELPAAAAIADTTANPTTTSVGAFNLGFNGTTWDRLRAGLSGTLTAIAGILNVFPIGRYNATTFTLNDGEYRGLQMDASGNLKTNPGYLVLSRSSSSALEASRVVKTSSGDFFRVEGYSTAAGFIQVHNANSLPADGVAPVISFAVAANQNFEQDYGALPYNLSTGIVVCFSSTQPTKTLGSASVWFEVGYI